MNPILKKEDWEMSDELTNVIEEEIKEPAPEMTVDSEAVEAESADEKAAGEAQEERPEVEGILEIADDGFGFLRFDNFLT